MGAPPRRRDLRPSYCSWKNYFECKNLSKQKEDTCGQLRNTGTCTWSGYTPCIEEQAACNLIQLECNALRWSYLCYIKYWKQQPLSCFNRGFNHFQFRDNWEHFNRLSTNLNSSKSSCMSRHQSSTKRENLAVNTIPWWSALSLLGLLCVVFSAMIIVA